MSKHILVVSQYFHPEPFRINDMCREWVRRGYQVTVLTGIPNYPQGKFYPGYHWFKKRKEEWHGVRIIRIPLFARGKTSVGMALNYASFVVSGFFWKLFTRVKADLVFNFEVSPMTQALVGVWYAKRRNIPCYLYVQDLWPENVEIVTGIHNQAVLGSIGSMVNYIYKHCTKIFATSVSFVSEIQKRVLDDPDKVLFWPQYAEEFYQPVSRVPVDEIPDNNSFKVIFTGNIGTAQGLDILPSAAVYLQRHQTSTHRPVQFVIVGDGRYKAEFLEEIRKNKVDGMFILIDRQPAERIPQMLAACDAAFLSFMDNPLFSKTIPAKLQSYMACAMPVAASAAGESQRIIQQARCGVCCPIGDAKGLAEGIQYLADLTQDAIEEMKQNSLRYCSEHFNKMKLMDWMDELLLQETRK